MLSHSINDNTLLGMTYSQGGSGRRSNLGRQKCPEEAMGFARGRKDPKDGDWGFYNFLMASCVYSSNPQHNVIKETCVSYQLRNLLVFFLKMGASDEMSHKKHFRCDDAPILWNFRGFLHLNVESYQWFWGHAPEHTNLPWNPSWVSLALWVILLLRAFSWFICKMETISLP